MAKIEPGMEAMVDMYIFETNTLLEQLDEILLRSEEANVFGDDDINEIFRIMHTVKGSSAMMGFENLQILAHKGEDMFFLIRDDPSKIEDAPFVYDLVFRMSDLFRQEIELIQSGDDYESTDFSDTIKELEIGAAKLTAAVAAPAETAAPPPDVSAPAAPAPANNTGQAAEPEKGASKGGNDSFTFRVYFQEGCKMENLRSFLVVNKLKERAEIVSFSPPDIETNSETANIIMNEGFKITARGITIDEARDIIEAAPNVESSELIDSPENRISAAKETPAPQAAHEVTLPPAPAPSHEKAATAPTNTPANGAHPKPAEAKEQSSSGAKQSIISVNLGKLDELHDIVGEIITTESMVIANPELEGLKLESFFKAARELKKLTDELQDTVMSIRMVPLSGPFQKMNRIVRDMKVKLNKDVELVIEGETTEVDKSIVDNLNDPLMHLVRNCMDHGIEKTSEERIREGKPAKATVKLAAVSSSGEVIITVSDDGAGIDTAKVLQKAEANGMLLKASNEYSEREIQNMILLPGFSTNDVVTEYSGRGVGMDVVRQNIEKCGGTLTVESKHGQGTSFIIKIPLTLAIIDGMEIAVGGTIFTVPISAIKSTFRVTNDQIIRDTQHGEMIMIRGVCYPIMRLHEKFNIQTDVMEFEDGILLLVETDDNSVCLFADRLIGELQVVVKPFPNYLSRCNIKGGGLSGCTIMGDGSISLIVDIPNLIENY